MAIFKEESLKSLKATREAVIQYSHGMTTANVAGNSSIYNGDTKQWEPTYNHAVTSTSVDNSITIQSNGSRMVLNKDEGSIALLSDGKEMIRMTERGGFYVQGKFVEADAAVYEGFVAFLKKAGLYNV